MDTERGPQESAFSAVRQVVSSCYQCGCCSGGCPLVGAMEHTPRALVRLLQFECWEEALRSNTIWLCATCHSCSAGCPRGVDLAGLMLRLRQLAAARGARNESLMFYQAVIDSLRRRGTIYEPELMLRYAAKAGPRVLLSQAELALHVARNGGVPLKPTGLADPTGFARALDLALGARRPGG